MPLAHADGYEQIFGRTKRRWGAAGTRVAGEGGHETHMTQAVVLQKHVVCTKEKKKTRPKH